MQNTLTAASAAGDEWESDIRRDRNQVKQEEKEERIKGIRKCLKLNP